MKMSVLYFSAGGNTKKMAGIIAEGMNSAESAEARCFSIDDFDEEFVKESRAVVLGTPIYLASMAGEVKTFLDKSAGKLGLAGKIGGAFATARFLHGGGEIGIQSILSHMMVFGMLAYSGGSSFGQPVIHLGPVALGDELEKSEETFRLYGERIALKTKEIFG